MNALRFDGRLKLVTDAPVPRREGEALVQVICAGICNTDLEIVKGYAGFKGTPGHEFVGRVVESPDATMLGRRVVGEINAGCGACALCVAGDPRHCRNRSVLGIKDRDGAFADFLSLPVRNLIELPDSVSDLAAVFAEPLAAALNILEQVHVDSTTKVAIVGDGKLAQLIAIVMAQTRCQLAVIGKHREKLSLAQRFGAEPMFASSTMPDFDNAGQFDIAIEASGSSSGLATALKLARPRGTVVLKSTHHGATRVDASIIVVNELRLIGSRCGRLRQAVEFLVNNRVELDQLITDQLPLRDALLAFERASAPETLKVILRIF